MKKSLLSTLLGISLISSAFASVEKEPPSSYLGVNFGATSYDSDLLDDTSSYELAWGLSLGHMLYGEMTYINFGEISFDSGFGSASIMTHGVNASLVAKFALSESFYSYAKLGYLTWVTEAESDGFTSEVDGSDVNYSVGAEYFTSDGLSVYAEFRSFVFEESDVSNIAFGMNINF